MGLPPQHFSISSNAVHMSGYTLPENLFYTYEVTGDPYFRELAQRYLMDKSYCNCLARRCG